MNVCASSLRVWCCLTWADLTRVCKSGQRFYSQKPQNHNHPVKFNYDKACMHECWDFSGVWIIFVCLCVRWWVVSQVSRVMTWIWGIGCWPFVLQTETNSPPNQQVRPHRPLWSSRRLFNCKAWHIRVHMSWNGAFGPAAQLGETEQNDDVTN